MTYLEKLINKYCPDGYEWKDLKDITKIYVGGDLPKKSFSETKNENFNVKILTNGSFGNNIKGYTDSYVVPGNSITISARGTIGYCEYQNEPFYPIIRLLAIHPTWHNSKFIYYFLKNLNISPSSKSGIPQLTRKHIENIKIPLIPLKIQEKIVEILERFRILEAELEARGKQFDFWINKLLNFSNFNKNNSKELQSIGCFISGLRSKNKDSFVDGNQRYISYLDVFNNKEINHLPNNFVKIFDDENQNNLNYGDVIFCGSSENFDETGYASVYTIKSDEKVYLNSFSFIFRFKDNELFLPKFSKYFFNCKDFRDLLLKCINGVTRFNLSKEKMSKIKIPIPPLKTQNKIVSILDKLSEYSQEINSGLPAEIELRSKQFKYYRDQLLNFKNNE
ncbi:restriction endonuclease subunit S [Mycoplasmopsis fermentans]|uniref:restriction endonuclease subunit S n=1 Tax=Mycoplasmopsis fermentans TaxID=2115 RepID=UPI0001E32E84|nr:restriction endonuclease subunit S [Mycoplasmopsis fermentans]ADN69055.1 type I site-specific deoxyribonuclease [Mycoplasmopsis fermentans JER]